MFGIALAFTSLYFLYLLFRVYRVWKFWGKAMNRWKNTIIISAIFLITSIVLVYSSFETDTAVYVSTAKTTVILIMGNLYNLLLLWLFSSKPLYVPEPTSGSTTGMPESEITVQEGVRQSRSVADSSVSFDSSITGTGEGRPRQQLFNEKGINIEIEQADGKQPY